ncbi:RNA polymerase II transcription factor B 52 kDa subunit [Puccinia graminis f. sp. tritici]|uniref:RNA polymerase II transcription factor B subunit 2 n=1 Tax=Puccinia graminis f. sp. tritici TaxID=56615 RepID=A0A5B0RY08_PUCGR|nr:RNA polymerase II transcription factor B 52 kDa subunit [Puccinia graminis f. sp. tritici]
MSSLRTTTTIPTNKTRTTTTTADFSSALYAFLNALPKLTLARLYNTPASCLAIFRSLTLSCLIESSLIFCFSPSRLLPLIARHLVLNLLWSDHSINKSQLELWADINHSESKTIIGSSRAPPNLTYPSRYPSIPPQSTSGNHCSFGVPCNTSPNAVVSIDELDRYGTEKWEPDRFYPTRLATTLTSTAPPLVSAERAQEEHGFLVLETNYRIYAYTSNPLQIAVLNLFLSLRYRFPNLVVGAVTRESIKSALSNGITADQVIMYLHTHAHPQMRKLEPLLPPTVVDQIRLWELEKNRIRAQEGYLYEDFKSAAEYDSVIQYSRKLGIVLWEHAGLRKLFVGYDGHLTLREFFRRGGASNGNM